MTQIVCSHSIRPWDREIAADSVCGRVWAFAKPAETDRNRPENFT